MEDDNTNKIVEELQRQTKTGIRINIIFVVVVAIIVIIPMIYLKYKGKSLDVKLDIPIWTKINEASSRNDRNEEIKLVKELLDKNPEDYYLHSYIGSLYVQKRELKLAKKHFETSYKLFPIKDTKDRLEAINIVIGN